jgi:beta-xylosidase
MRHRLRRPAALPSVLLALVIAACSSGGGSGGPSGSAGASGGASGGSSPSAPASAGESAVASGGSASASAPASPSASVIPTPGEGEFANPVIRRNMPDPYVLKVDDTYYLYSTEDGSNRYPYATSTDLVTWEYQGSAMPRPPAWTDRNYWAPEVTETSAGFVMYYTARSREIMRPSGDGAQCVGVAVAETPEGPFVDENDGPLVCQAELGGTIDASVVRDQDDSLWLIYKNDGNCCSIPTRFYMRQMAEDGLTFAGDEIEVAGVVNDERWEGNVVEAPTIHFLDGTYYLFYSANDYAGVPYAVGYATSTQLTGPYEDAPENPILSSVQRVGPFGPGHQTLIEDPDGDLWMVYHAWERTFSQRQVWIDELVFEGGKPVVQGPDVEPQPVP